MFNLFRKKEVRVEFSDLATGEVIGQSFMKPGQLPETFELDTTLTLSGQQWRVVSADPPHSKDFIASGSLKLKLQKIEQIDPKNILYTTPTISNEFPVIAESAAAGSFQVEFHEDDWRQKEFLNKSSHAVIQNEIASIKEIWSDHSKKIDDKFTAFDKVHVRSAIGNPGLHIDMLALRQVLGAGEAGSAFVERQGYLENGFSIKTPDTVYIGTAINNMVRELCVLGTNENTINEIRAITARFGLIFVDWRNCEIITGNA